MDALRADTSGPNTISQIKPLLKALCDLAATYRHYHSLGDSTGTDSTIADYLATMGELQSLGWHGALDFECELPYEYMPETYCKDVGCDAQW